jgi:glycosyltransferase involved in cell wall biosynthesis
MRHRSLFRSSPAATIAMVTYNSARFLREAIDSVLAQDFTDFELLICDDGSRDATWEIIQSYDDPRIRAVRNEVNVGEYRNRNRALALARGRYLMYLDGDDVLYPHGLAIMVRTMEQFPRAGFATGVPPCEKFIYPVELTPHDFCACAYFGPPVIGNDFTQLFFRTSTLRELGGFDVRYRTGDTHIQYSLGMRTPCVLFGGGLAWWRRRSGQASEQLVRSGLGLAEMWRYCHELLDDRACPLDAAEKQLARLNLSRTVMRNAVRRGLHGNVSDAVRMVTDAGVPIREWACVFTRFQAPFFAEMSGENPLHLTPAIVAKTPPRRAVRPVVQPRRIQPRLMRPQAQSLSMPAGAD